LQTSSAAPSSGTFFSMPCSAAGTAPRTSSQLRKRIRNSGTMLKIQPRTTMLGDGQRQEHLRDAPAQHAAAAPAAGAAAATMKTAFWMFMPAITRDSSSRGVRLWISANSGTTKKPENRPMPARSSTMRHAAGLRRKPPTSRPGAAPPGEVQVSRKALMPNAPSGTRPISTVRADSFSHSSEPTPVPIENTASANTYSVGVPPRWVSA
jgi:hypothetical protein